MITLAQICNQYAWLYTSLPTPAGTWDHVIPTDGCYVCIKNIDGTDYVMFRGSVTFLDWLQDFQADALPFPDPHLGWVHNGFRDGVLKNIGYINSLVGPRVVVVGHSLGAGHAALYAGYRAADRLPVDALVMFGEPRPGGPRLAAVLTNTHIESYVNGDGNGHDAVTDVPYDIEVPFIGGIHYQHPKPLLGVSAAPSPDDHWGPFKYHHFGLYCRAVGASGPAALSLPV